MDAKAIEAMKMAICMGCAHHVRVVAKEYCRKHKEQTATALPLCSSIQDCEYWSAEVVNQLLTSDVGYGLVIQTNEDGTATAKLFAGPAGEVFTGDIATMFTDSPFYVVPSYRIIDKDGHDVTQKAMQMIILKAMREKSDKSDAFSQMR